MAFCIAIKGRGKKKNEVKELKLDRANFQINQGTTAEKKFTPLMRRTVGKMDAPLAMPWIAFTKYAYSFPVDAKCQFDLPVLIFTPVWMGVVQSSYSASTESTKFLTDPLNAPNFPEKKAWPAANAC